MVKRTPADGYFSDCVRLRTNYTCEHCGLYVPDGYRQNAHCAHIISRKHKNLRHDPDNALMLCGSCHSDFTNDPLLFAQFIEKYLGNGLHSLLLEKKHVIRKKYKGEEKEKSKHYREEYKRMLKLRENGEEGRIEFIGFY